MLISNDTRNKESARSQCVSLRLDPTTLEEIDKESARSQCVSLRLDPTTLEEIEEEVIKNKGVTLSAAMNQKLNAGFKLIVKTAKNEEVIND